MIVLYLLQAAGFSASGRKAVAKKAKPPTSARRSRAVTAAGKKTGRTVAEADKERAAGAQAKPSKQPGLGKEAVAATPQAPSVPPKRKRGRPPKNDKSAEQKGAPLGLAVAIECVGGSRRGQHLVGKSRGEDGQSVGCFGASVGWGGGG